MPGRLSLGGRVVLGCLALWALAVVTPDFLRVFDQSFNNTLPFEADNNGDLANVRPSSSVADCQSIDLKRNYCDGRISDLLAVFGGLGVMQYVRRDVKSVSLYFHCTNPSPQSQAIAQPSARPYTPFRFLCTQSADAAASQLRTVETEIKPLAFPARITLLSAQILAVLFISLAFRLVLIRPSTATLGFFLYAIWFNPGQSYVFYAVLQHWSSNLLLGQEVAQAVFQAIGYCGFILFALRFPRNEIIPGWRWLELVLPAIGVIVLLVQLYAFLPVFGFRAEWAARGTFVAGALVDILVLAILFIRYRRQTVEDRQRLRYVFWCSVIGLGAYTLAEIDASTTLLSQRLPDWILYLLYSLSASVAVAVFHAVVRYRVVDVKFTLSRHVTYGVLWFLVAIPLIWLTQIADAFAATIARQYVGHQDLWIDIAILLVAAVPMKFVVDFTHERAIKLFDNVFFHKLLQAEKTIGQLIDRLNADGPACTGEKLSLEKVERDLVAIPAEALELTSAALFRLDKESYVRVHAHDWRDDANNALAGEHAIIRKLKANKKVWLRPDPTDLPSKAGPPALAVSIRCRGILEAVLFYGAHRGGDDLNDDELRMIEKLAAAASTAYKTVAFPGSLSGLDARP
jgi:hypothetical protein